MNIARACYSIGWLLLLPVVLARLIWRARLQPEYLRHLGERFGRYACSDNRPLIWIHAVSVGETRAAQPLVEQLLRTYPGHRLLITHMTPTGRDTSESLWGSRVARAYLPYDLPFATRAFLRHWQPRLGILMETELWPNLIVACHQQRVPLLLANARLSERSARGYRRLSALAIPALGQLSAVAAQTEDDATRLGELGAPQPHVVGNIKFDVSIPPAALLLGDNFRQQIGPRPVLLAASTREGEEAPLLTAFARLAPPACLLLLVPRHPQRFDEVAALATRQGLPLQRRSEGGPVQASTRVWLGDSMGEMAAYYRVADVAFVGGSLLPLGGQNLIEACAQGVPVLIGPHTFNFAAASAEATAAGAAERVEDAEAVITRALALLSNAPARQAMGDAGRAFSDRHRGATARTLALVQTLYPIPRA